MTQLVPGIKVKVGGSELDPDIATSIEEARVENNLNLPDMFLIRVNDPRMEHIDSSPFDIGKEIEIQFESPEGQQGQPVFHGEVTSIEPDFDRSHGVAIVVRGYDFSHRLNRSKATKTYQNSTFGDVASKVIQEAGLQPGTIESSKGGTQDFLQQSAETGWDFLWKLAKRVDCEVVAEGKQIHFRKAGGPSGGNPIDLKWGEKLLSFRPRITGVQQVQEVTVRSWDHKTKRAITSTKSSAEVGSEIGIPRSQAMTDGLAGAKLLISDRPVTTQAEGDDLAESVITRLANSYIDATGSASGDPDLKAGVKVKIAGVGQKFSGTYTLTSATHLYKGGKGYTTEFSISGRTNQSLFDVISGGQSQRDWGNSIVIGVVTNNQDPDSLGRVRVKYPSLSDKDEGWWARLTSPASGKDRGVMMLPQVNEEVLIGFEHGDSRKPYVLGSVWNAKDTPGDLVQKDGSYVLQSDKQVIVKAHKNVSIKTEKDFLLETKADQKLKATGDYKLEGKSLDMKGSTTVSLKGGQSVSVQADGTVSIKGGSQVSVEASGALSIKAMSVTISAPNINLG